MRFRDRAEAGRRLARAVAHLRGTDLVVLGLPRGGVPVAWHVARALGAPLDLIVVRKVWAPGRPDLAIGAVGEDGTTFLDTRVAEGAGVKAREVPAALDRARADLARRLATLRGDRARVPVAGRTVVVVSDGMATGWTARAACQAARVRGAARVVLAVPVASACSVHELTTVADAVVCLLRPALFRAVHEWYHDFGPPTDEEIVTLLRRARGAELPGRTAPGHGTAGPLRAGGRGV